jgi:hypothetical protein
MSVIKSTNLPRSRIDLCRDGDSAVHLAQRVDQSIRGAQPDRKRQDVSWGTPHLLLSCHAADALADLCLPV